ncbi:uncharacterized protein LOC141912336 [Tubulanus polymorphus]|uniref:uncharacterized protein LOC141912336 n=1 Tax=Tubulanus polymorphus TaxID=672921 RepID=UPI003DA30048
MAAASVPDEDVDNTDEKIKEVRSKSAYLEQILDNISKQSSYQKKYFTLRRKCEQTQQANEKLINRLYYSKVLCKLYKKERRLLMNCLDDYGDDFRDAQVPVMWEEVSPPVVLPRPDPSVVATTSIGNNTSSPPATTSTAASLVKRIKIEKCERDAPKKPVHPFVLFSEHNTKALKEAYFKEHKTESTAHDLSRVLAEKWQHLPPQDRKIYQDLYDSEKKRYDVEMKDYLQWMRSPASSSIYSTSAIPDSH